MRGMEVPVRHRTSPMKILFVRPKPLARRLSAKRRANKTRIRPVLSLGSPGSPLALADGTAITNHQAQRPCERVGTNSKPWQRAIPLQTLDKIRESRRGRGGAFRIISLWCGLFVVDVQYNRVEGIVGRLRARAIAVGGAKFVNAGSLRVGDALERYGESRRAAIVQLSPRPRVVGGRGTGMQPLRGSRRSVRLEEQYGRNRCKVN